MPDEDSPRISGLCWGEIEVEGHGTFKDAKTWPGGARAWDWNETGTSHSPGVQPADVQELVDNGAETVVLTRGQQGRLQVQEETLAWLTSKGVDVQVLATDAAVTRYNELVDAGAMVGGLFHSTC